MLFEKNVKADRLEIHLVKPFFSALNLISKIIEYLNSDAILPQKLNNRKKKTQKKQDDCSTLKMGKKNYKFQSTTEPLLFIRSGG